MLIRIFLQLKKYWPFLTITLIALFLRAYRIDTLTTFGRDQGIDFLVVKDIIETHKPTLIGIKSSIANFYQGPNYLYILLPFFLLLNLNPLAGAISALCISLFTVIILYVLCLKFFNQKIAVVSSLLFAVSPEFVQFGNTPLYQNFTPLFIFICLYLFFDLQLKKSILKIFLLGLSLGITMEIHFLVISLVIAIFIYQLIYSQKRLMFVLLYFSGLITGLLPTISFELRHNFLNTHYLIDYLTALHSGQNNYVIAFREWLEGASHFLGANTTIGGVLIFLVFLIFLRQKQYLIPAKNLKKILVLELIIALIFSFVLSTFGSHYLLPVWCMGILLIPIFFLTSLKAPLSYILIGIIISGNLLAAISSLNQNHGYTMPSGWNLRKILATADIIKLDSMDKNIKVNVASLLDGDTRTYPLRYSLAYKKVLIDGVDDYPKSNVLYIVAGNDPNQLKKSGVWEIVTFSPFIIAKTWDLGDNVLLYRLDH